MHNYRKLVRSFTSELNRKKNLLTTLQLLSFKQFQIFSPQFTFGCIVNSCVHDSAPTYISMYLSKHE